MGQEEQSEPERRLGNANFTVDAFCCWSSGRKAGLLCVVSLRPLSSTEKLPAAGRFEAGL